MIFDSIGQLGRYPDIPLINDVMIFLTRPDLHELKEPEIAIRGRELFVRVMRYHAKPAEQNRFETHRVYADVQVMLKGKEIMQTARPEDLSATTEYDQQNDYQFFKADQNISQLVVNPGEFVVFFPGDPHRPSCLAPDYDGENLKLVFKIRMGKA
jgi:YhcH/YjgK/YiaL family protein